MGFLAIETGSIAQKEAVLKASACLPCYMIFDR